MDGEAELVALGGLLHDIGKFEQRGKTQNRRHQDFGYEFLKKYVERYLKEYGELPLFARYHHRDDLKTFNGSIRLRNLLNIVCEADNISSGERREIEEDAKFRIENPLECVFSSVNLGKGDAKKMYYPLRTYSPESYFHPVISHKNTSEDYGRLFDDFEKEFDTAIKSHSFNHLLHVLEKYTTFIPTMLTENNDISLFDHLKTTSAIALCMYHYHRKQLDEDIEKEIEDRKEKKYLIVGGDISGIQEFIYTITSKGALKYLRSRSLFLELLVEDVVAELIERLELTRANIIFAGGGRFYIITHNTEEAKRIIKDVAMHVNRWLFDRFWGKLYFAVDSVEVNGEELSRFRIGEKSIWEVIGKSLKKKKLRKFLDIAKEGDFIENYIPDSEEFGECDVCKGPRILHNVENNKVCESCREFLLIGGEIPKSDGFARVKGKVMVEVKYTLPFSSFVPIRVDEVDKYNEGLLYLKGHRIETKNSEKLDELGYILLNVGDYYSRDEDKSVKEFDKLAEGACGVKKLAVLRMDVDDLGKIFSIGLKGSDTISRVTTLSRFMNHFFKNCIDLICEGSIPAEVVGETPRIKSGRKRKEVVVVYAGGDDLFIVGAWDHVFELAFEIEGAFRRYVGANPNITISAGYAIFDPKFPLYRMAEITGNREEVAKKDGDVVAKIDGVEIRKKNRIHLGDRGLQKAKSHGTGIAFRESYEWDEFRRIWSEYVTRIYDSGESKLLVRRSAIRRILDARREYLKNPNGFRWSVLLTYYLARIKVEKNGAEKKGSRMIDVVPKLATRDPEKVREKRPQDIYHVDIPLKFVDLAVRGGG
ncbi:type III-A CRISPR-associated protein Cas10/Csm1 [Geoglobus acetivorans]|uniref:CRISPR system single-strand-specific deoxyribonuclease Cas10/Csm1 (subtype III-A) n=1 Tax=Geoglobus acetivorans TaxID=565033 RepID=A0ABZ3H326_GEOAI|nr:type III-A CRISPR-associated protein Cas10/Csm1 [Geoglobus acetivorans]